MEQLSVYNFFFHSSHRNSGTIADCTWKLPKIITNKTPSSFFTAKIYELTMPFTWKQLNTTTPNSWTYTITRGATNTSSITIPPGNYSIISLLSKISTLLIASVLSLTGVTLVTDFTYNSDTMTASLTLTDATATTITFASNTGIQEMLGFSSVISFTNLTTATSTTCVNMATSLSLYIRSSNLSQSDNYEAVSSAIETSDIIVKCPINVQPTNIIRYVSYDNDEITITNRTIDSINLYVTDRTSYDTPLALLLDWSCQMTIKEWQPRTNTIEAMLSQQERKRTITALEEQRNKHIDDIDSLRNKLSKS